MSKVESKLLSELLSANLFDTASSLNINRPERKKMLKNLLKYYQLHVENFTLRSPEILEEILE